MARFGWRRLCGRWCSSRGLCRRLRRTCGGRSRTTRRCLGIAVVTRRAFGLYGRRGRGIASALALNRLARLKVVPPAVRDHGARLPWADPTAVKDRDPSHGADRPAQAARSQRRPRGGLLPRHQQDATHLDPPPRRAQSASRRIRGEADVPWLAGPYGCLECFYLRPLVVWFDTVLLRQARSAANGPHGDP
jgi:hypothetical protein